MGAPLQDPSVPAAGVEIPEELLRDGTPPASPRLEELRKLEARPIGRTTDGETGVGGAIAATALVLGLLIGAFLLLKKLMGRSRLFASGTAFRILARRPLAPRQEVILLEVGSRVLIVGSGRDSLARLGEMTGAEEIAALRARCGVAEPAAPKPARESSAPPPAGKRGRAEYGEIVEELSRLRSTVRDWSREEAAP